MGKKRVFWYCEKWQVGGIQTIQVNLLKRFSRDQLSFDLVVSEDDTSIFDDDIIAAGARKIVTLKRRYSSPAIRVLANFFAVRKVLKNGHYDVAHFNVCHGVELIYVFWAKVYRIPLRIVHCRNNNIGAGGRGRAVKLLAHRICRRLFRGCANVQIANSDLAAKWLFGDRETANGHVFILNNGLELQNYRFDAQKREMLRKQLDVDAQFVLGHIGHFSYQKNHTFLLQVFCELLKWMPESTLLLIGSGDGEAEAVRQAEALGIRERIHFCGVTKDVPAYLCAMDAFVLPSRFEGFGNVLVEAQAAGLPCFASEGVIPRSVAITDRLTWIPLENGPKTWARMIAGTPRPISRTSCWEQVLHSGYDISDMAQKLEHLYCAYEGTGVTL